MEGIRDMILDLLKERKSVRDFAEKEVPEEVINYILEAGRLSPSGGNAQSWKFGLVTDRALINEISELAYNQKWIKKASFLIVLCTKNLDKSSGRYIQKSRFPSFVNEIENMDDELYTRLHMEEHQTKIPGTHMMMAALEHGVGSTWISLFKVDEVSQLLNLKKPLIASEIIAFGYPAKKTEVTPKKSLNEIVFYNKFSSEE